MTTMGTIALGAVAILIFGAFTLFTTYGLQTLTVQRIGHLAVYQDGYFNFGTGNPANWGIGNYKEVVALIQGDPVLAPMLAVVTPAQSLSGIAGNAQNGSSKTFLGVGFVPSDRDRMKHWDEYGVSSSGLKRADIADDDTSDGIAGLGITRILGLCEQLHLDNCPPQRAAPADSVHQAELSQVASRDFTGLAEPSAAPGQDGHDEPRIDLLSATAGGAPNVVTLNVHRVEYQGVKELDDSYVGMNLILAQQLVYGRGEHKATGIVLQLHRTEDMAKAHARLLDIFKAHNLDLEVRDFTELSPFYTQALGLFRSIFSFISVIIGVVVLFTVTNAMGMSVVERIDEIGTTRALGVRRAGIRRQFLFEGAIIGVFGATLGVLAAYLVAYIVNSSGLTWTPPGNVQPVPLKLYLYGAWTLTATAWIALIAVATIASVAPAARAARLKVVDALRHV
jgi:putative ABC transport system permease protein